VVSFSAGEGAPDILEAETAVIMQKNLSRLPIFTLAMVTQAGQEVEHQ
jgi:hypothetical protein